MDYFNRSNNEELQDIVFSQQEKRSKLREFDLEAATGRKFETR